MCSRLPSELGLRVRERKVAQQVKVVFAFRQTLRAMCAMRGRQSVALYRGMAQPQSSILPQVDIWKLRVPFHHQHHHFYPFAGHCAFALLLVTRSIVDSVALLHSCTVPGSFFFSILGLPPYLVASRLGLADSSGSIASLQHARHVAHRRPEYADLLPFCS
jgi:hypothetical protein